MFQNQLALMWPLQSAIFGGLAISAVGMGITFARPAVRVLAAYLITMTVASLLIWAAYSPQLFGWSPAVGPLLSVFALPFVSVISFVFERQLLLLLSGQANRTAPGALIIAQTTIASIAVMAFAFAVYQLAVWYGILGRVTASEVVRTATWFIAYTALASLAWRAFRQAKGSPGAIKLVGASFALLAVRSASNLAALIVLADPIYRPPVGIEFVSLRFLLIVLAGVLQLMAVLIEERNYIVSQAEQVRLVEAALARSHRMESLGRMSGAVAHDFNNLLAVIAISAESARIEGATGREVDLREILAATKRGQNLTKQLIAFARQTPQQVTQFDASCQLDTMNSLLQRMVGKSVVLTLNAAPTAQCIEMDVTQFEQVVTNLIVNARDAMPNGGKVNVTVAPAAAPGDADARLVRITVADTGFGISADVLPHIFDPFFSTKSSGEGSGVGLATCDGIVRRAGGRIDVTSTMGEGVRFDVLIPRVVAA